MFTISKTPVNNSSSTSSRYKADLAESDLQRKNYAQPKISGYDFGNISLFPVQPKLKVNTPGDKFEQEADQMAEKVMRMPDDKLIQRKCAKCEEEEKEKIQRKGETSVPSITPTFQNHLKSSTNEGQPLPSIMNRFMSNAFSADFSHVRIHDNETANQLNRNIHAKAFTYGRDIYFTKGQFSPETTSGKKLLAHELTHVLQQNSTKRIQRKDEEKKFEPIHDFSPKKGGKACACLIHIHNDERNSKAVAQLLNTKCNYNLIDVKDSASNKKDPRSLKKSLKIINESGKAQKKSDPNEIFSPEVIKTCKDPTAKGKLLKKGINANEVCSIYQDLQTCSNDFSIPVVALHNNTELAAKDKKDVKKAEKESTNIYRWKISKAIEKTVVGDKDNPDRVVWTSNPADFKKLEKAGDINTALQDKQFIGDTDLSTLFNSIPEISALENPNAVDAIANALVIILKLPVGITKLLAKNIYMELKYKEARYINIETEHKKNKYEQNLAEVNLEFVHKVLSKLGLWCCDESLDMKKLKGDLKEVPKGF